MKTLALACLLSLPAFANSVQFKASEGSVVNVTYEANCSSYCVVSQLSVDLESSALRPIGLAWASVGLGRGGSVKIYLRPQDGNRLSGSQDEPLTLFPGIKDLSVEIIVDGQPLRDASGSSSFRLSL